LLLAMRDNDFRVRTDALRALQAICADAPEPLISALHDQSASVRAAATEVLGTLDERAIPALLAVRDDLDADVAWRVRDALDALGHADPVEELIGQLPDSADALVRHGEEAVGPLKAVLTSPRPNEMRVAAARALSRLGDEGTWALISALQDERPQVWVRAMDALGTWPATLHELFGLDVRAMWAGLALLLEGDPSLALTVVREGNDTVRMMLAQLLPGSPTHDAKVALMRLMEDDDLVVREAATRSAGEMGAEILPSLAPLVHDPHAAVQRAVKDALRTIGSEAVPFLLDLASGSEGQARELAVSVLSDIGTPAAVFGLVERGIAVQPR
jgi:HEAT repeat protein